MKSLKAIIFIIVAVVLPAGALITVPFLLVKTPFSMKDFFIGFENKTDIAPVNIKGRSVVMLPSGELDLEEFAGSDINEVYYVKNGKIYFCYSEMAEDSQVGLIWTIASIDTTGEIFQPYISVSAKYNQYSPLSQFREATITSADFIRTASYICAVSPTR